MYLSQIMWKSPPTRVIKVDWDVAVDKPNESIDIDIIVWDRECTCNNEYNKTLYIGASYDEIIESVAHH
jgi:hypothetical protein